MASNKELIKELIKAFKLIIVDANISKEDKLRYLEKLDERNGEHIIDVLDRDYIEEMGYYSQSGDFKRLGSKMSESYCEQDKSIEFNALVELCNFTRHHKCAVCGKTVYDGFHALSDNDKDLPFPTDIYLCSAECKDKIFTEEEWKTLSEEEPEEYFYSEWR